MSGPVAGGYVWRAAIAASAVLFLARLPLAGAKVEEKPIGVVDLHVDLAYQHNYRSKDFATGTGQYVANTLERAGVIGAVLPLYIPRSVSPTGPRLQDLETSYIRVFGALLKSPTYRLPGCTRQGRPVSTWLAFEGSAPLLEEPESVSAWIARGVRLFGLVHSYNTPLAGSSGAPSQRRTGLTKKGRALSRRIMKAGGIIDVSHASDQSTQELLALAKELQVPLVATHSNARSLAAHPRNLTDELLRGIASTGGVVGVNFHSAFLARGRPAKLEDVVRHVQHMLKVAGENHVAIGSDFEGDIRPPAGLENASKLRNLSAALLEAGLTRQQLRKLFHENALRILCRARTGG